MLILFAQVFAIFFSILVIAKSYLSLKQHRESVVMTLFWSVTWLGIVVIALYPDLIDKLLGKAGNRAGTGTILAIGLIFIYFVIYRIYVKADRIEKKLNNIVRSLAIKDSE